MRSPDLLDYNQPFCALDFQAESRSVSWPQRRMAPRHGQLDVLGIVIAAPNDDHILDASRDIDLTVAHEAQVSGAQEWTLAINEAAEGARRFFGSAPVTRRHARACYANLPDLRGST